MKKNYRVFSEAHYGNKWKEFHNEEYETPAEKFFVTGTEEQVKKFCDEKNQPFIDSAVQRITETVERFSKSLIEHQTKQDSYNKLDDDTKKVFNDEIRRNEDRIETLNDDIKGYNEMIDLVKSNPFGGRHGWISIRFAYEEIEFTEL